LALTVSVLWLAGSVIAVLAWCFFDGVRIGYALMCVTFGSWMVVAMWALVPFLSFVQVVRRSLGGNAKHALAWSALPVAAMLIFFYGADAGEILRFQVNRHAYQRVVADAAAGRCSEADRKQWRVDIDAIECSVPVLIVFIWGGFGSIWNGVVYDAADQIAEPASKRSRFWKQRDSGSLLSCSGASMDLGNHFYLAGGFYSDAEECG
jgi:hypothetical protein